MNDDCQKRSEMEFINDEFFIPQGENFGFVSARPGATGSGYAIVFTTYECLTFDHRILTCQVWARDLEFIDSTKTPARLNLLGSHQQSW
jgi:hypothetical protein